MEEGTKETMWKTRNKEREHSTGLMEGNILENGKEESSMVEECILAKKGREGKVNGKMEEKLDGQTTLQKELTELILLKISFII